MVIPAVFRFIWIASFSAQSAEGSHHWCFIITEVDIATIMEFTDLICSLITVSQLTLHANIAQAPPTHMAHMLQCIFLSIFNFDSSVGIQRLQYTLIKAHIVITLTCENVRPVLPEVIAMLAAWSSPQPVNPLEYKCSKIAVVSFGNFCPLLTFVFLSTEAIVASRY